MPKTATIPPPVGDRQTLLDRNFSLKPKTAALPPGAFVDEYGLWIPEKIIDDSPQQTRSAIHPHERAVTRLMASFEANGQLSAIQVRIHPADPNRVQHIWGHRRKYIVRWGANAGPPHLSPAARKKYLGFVKCTLETAPLTDEDMLSRAITENEEHEQISILDRGNGYLRLYKMVEKSSGLTTKEEIWNAVKERTGKSYQQMIRLAYVAELPKEWQSEFASKPEGEGQADRDADEFVLDGTHLRALYTLKKWPDAQRNLWNAIRREHWNGTTALRYATETSKKLRVQQPTLEMQEEDATAAQKRAAASANVVAEQADALARGEAPTHLRIVRDELEPQAPQSAATVPAAVTPDGDLKARIEQINGKPLSESKSAPLTEEQINSVVKAINQTSPESQAVIIENLYKGRSQGFMNYAWALGKIDPQITYLEDIAPIAQVDKVEYDALQKQIRNHIRRLETAAKLLADPTP